MATQSTKTYLAIGAALLLAGTAAFSGLAEAQFRGDGVRPGGGSGGPPSGGGGGGKSGGGGGGGGGGGSTTKGASPAFKPGPGPGPGANGPPPTFKPGPSFGGGGSKGPPSGGGGWKGGPSKGGGWSGPPPPPPRHRPRPPGVRFWYYSGIPIFASDYDGCGYEYYKWRTTGSSYWRSKFYQCVDDED